MSTFMAIAIVLIESLAAFAGLHLFARWTIRNIDRGRAAVGVALDRTAATRRNLGGIVESSARLIAQRINELIRAGEFGINLDETPFLCECTDPRCHAVVWLAPEEFDHLRGSGGPVLRSDPDIAETPADAPVVALAGRVGVHADRTLAI